MKTFMGIVAGALIVIGAVVLIDAFSVTGVRSVLHQQYVMGELLLSAVLVCFGLLCAGVAGIIDAIERIGAPVAERAPVERDTGLPGWADKMLDAQTRQQLVRHRRLMARG